MGQRGREVFHGGREGKDGLEMQGFFVFSKAWGKGFRGRAARRTEHPRSCAMPEGPAEADGGAGGDDFSVEERGEAYDIRGNGARRRRVRRGGAGRV